MSEDDARTSNTRTVTHSAKKAYDTTLEDERCDVGLYVVVKALGT